jgi:hypothetical protein
MRNSTFNYCLSKIVNRKFHPSRAVWQRLVEKLTQNSWLKKRLKKIKLNKISEAMKIYFRPFLKVDASESFFSGDLTTT